MPEYDAAGLPLTLQDAAPWDRVVTAFLAHSAATPELLASVLRTNPGFAMGWAAKGIFYLLLGRSELTPVAAEALENARNAAAGHGATARELSYIDALAAYLADVAG